MSKIATVFTLVFICFGKNCYAQSASMKEAASTYAIVEKDSLSLVVRDVVVDREIETARLLVEVTENSRSRLLTFSSLQVSPPTFVDAARQFYGSIKSVPPVCPYTFNTHHCQYFKTTKDQTLLLSIEFHTPGVRLKGEGFATFSIYWIRPGETESIFTVTSGPFAIKLAADLR